MIKVKNRVLSYIIILAVYAVAAACGILCYIYLPSVFWLKLLVADIAATVVTFAFSLLFGNASVYDPYWSVQPMVITVAYAFAAQKLTIVHILALIAVNIWGARLTANWAYTFGDLTHQDWRYTMLHDKTKKLYPIVNFVGIHLVPTLVVYGCILPVAFLFEYSPQFNAGYAVFIALSLVAVAIEGASDIQMHKYRKARNGNFIRNGLWKYSRHPNYLGEISFWWAIALAYICVDPARFYLAAGALANTLLFLCVSIPLADKRQSRKEGYAEYKAQTRMLLPIKK